MNIGGSRVDAASLGWHGDKLVFTGYMVAGDEKLPVNHTFTKKGDAAYSALEVTGARTASQCSGKKRAARRSAAREQGRSIPKICDHGAFFSWAWVPRVRIDQPYFPPCQCNGTSAARNCSDETFLQIRLWECAICRFPDRS